MNFYTTSISPLRSTRPFRRDHTQSIRVVQPLHFLVRCHPFVLIYQVLRNVWEVGTEKSLALCIIATCSSMRQCDKMLLTLSFSTKTHKRQYCWLESYKWGDLPREPGVTPACSTQPRWLWWRSRAMRGTSGKQSPCCHTSLPSQVGLCS